MGLHWRLVAAWVLLEQQCVQGDGLVAVRALLRMLQQWLSGLADAGPDVGPFCG